MVKVSLVKTADHGEGARKAIKLLGINPVKGKSVRLKPNYNTSDPFPASTHPENLRSVVECLHDMGAKDIVLGERSGMADTREALETAGVYRLAKEMGFTVVNFDKMDRDGWVHIRPPGSHWKDGFLFVRQFQEAEAVVQTCCLKTHRFGGHFTLSLKNSVALVPRHGYTYMNELHSSPYQRLMIAEINTAYSTDLIVLDGVEAFVNGGPEGGKRRKAGVMLAGYDRIAVDAVGVAILRQLGTTPEVANGPIFELEQIRRAAELGVGVKSAGEIEIVTGDESSERYASSIRQTLMQVY